MDHSDLGLERRKLDIVLDDHLDRARVKVVSRPNLLFHVSAIKTVAAAANAVPTRTALANAPTTGGATDPRYLGMAFRWVSEVLTIDHDRVALGGVSDGAGYALSMGLAYGDTFNHLMIFSGGLMQPFRRQGKPKIFLAHGIKDEQMPIDRTARRFVPELKDEGYDVTYREYDGGHGAPAAVVREAFEWFAPKRG